MVNIAVMGYGTVGSGVVEVVNTNGARINQRIGDELNIKYVLDLRDFPGDPVQDKIIHDFETIVNDDEIKIVRSKKFDIKPMYAEDACIQMELLGHDFFVFCNAETDEVNVVYKRKGNTYGLIEPEN